MQHGRRPSPRTAGLVTLAIVATVAFGRAVLDGPWALVINGLFLVAVLGAPLAAAVAILTHRWQATVDAPDTELVRPGDEWIAAVRSELAAVDDPLERRQFARVLLTVVVRRTLTPWTWLLAASVATALALGLLALSRSRVGEGAGDYTLFVPPLALFVVGAIAARRLGSFSQGLVVAGLAAMLSAAAMLPVAATEAARLFNEAGVAFLDGEPVQFDSASAAVRDTLHPVFVVLHLLFWLPGPVLGARLGARAKPPLDPAISPTAD